MDGAHHAPELAPRARGMRVSYQATVRCHGAQSVYNLPFDVTVADLSAMCCSAGYENAITRAASTAILSDCWRCSLCGVANAITTAHSPIFLFQEGEWKCLDAACLPVCCNGACALAAAHRTRAARRQIREEARDRESLAVQHHKWHGQTVLPLA